MISLVITCVQAVFISFDFRFPNIYAPGDRQDEKAGHKGQQIIQQPKMLYRVATELMDVWAIAHLAGRSHIPSPHHLNFEGKINLQKFNQCTFLNILYPNRRCGQFFLLALTAHHTQSLMSDNRKLCITVDISANYICYFEYSCSH